MIKTPQEFNKEYINNEVLKFLNNNFETINKDGGKITIPNEWSINEINIAEQILNSYNWQVQYNKDVLNNEKTLKLIPMKIITQEELVILEASKTAAVSERINKQSTRDIIPNEYPPFEIKEEEKNG